MKSSKNIESIAMRITEGVGTPASIFVHTIAFGAVFLLPLMGIPLDSILLILTTVVSLEAIYLAIFIQMTVNRNIESLEGVEEDIEEIQEDVRGIESGVEEISKDVEEISQEVGDISEDVEEISEDMDKIQEKEKEGDMAEANAKMTLEKIEHGLQTLLADIEQLKRQR